MIILILYYASSFIRTADGNFRYTPADGSNTIGSVTYSSAWGGRVAGDEDTSPHPEFIGQISDIFFLETD